MKLKPPIATPAIEPFDCPNNGLYCNLIASISVREGCVITITLNGAFDVLVYPLNVLIR